MPRAYNVLVRNRTRSRRALPRGPVQHVFRWWVGVIYKTHPVLVPVLYGQEVWVMWLVRPAALQRKFQRGIRRRSVGTSDRTFIMSALPLAGVTVIEVRIKDVIRLTMHRILTTVSMWGSSRGWRPARTQVKSYKTGVQGSYASTGLGKQISPLISLQEESVPSPSIQKSLAA